ncbi:uncharacterized protein LOC134191288 [Corticium candelabrum]|uniref:uncharacterized protein LOC134191288 n=1 Tax=Corticium candelabrum TaxID=121492 RepID=UPI002E274C5E|nr:uncharacterized protein LOC134191288 [Corticium candelabrum]
MLREINPPQSGMDEDFVAFEIEWACHSAVNLPSEIGHGSFIEEPTEKITARVDWSVGKHGKRRMTLPVPPFGVTFGNSNGGEPRQKSVKIAWKVTPATPDVNTTVKLQESEPSFDTFIEEESQHCPLSERPRKPSLINRNRSEEIPTQRKVSGIIRIENSQSCHEGDRNRDMRHYMCHEK